MRLEEKRWVERPQEEAFDYTADFSNIQAWDPGVVSSRRIGSGPIGIGSQFDVEVKFGQGTLPMVYEIVEFEPESRVVLRGVGEKLEAVDEIKFATHDNLTLIEYTADLEFKNYLRFLGPVLNPTLKKVGEKALDGLVDALDR